MMNSSIIDEIKNRIDPVELIGEYTRLEKKGKEYRGLCPFHREKTPSFYVNAETGLYHCFGCGASGNIFKFVMEMENVDFQEALRILAKRAGIELKTYKEPPYAVAIKKIASYLHMQLKKQGNKALAYLESRGIKNNIVEKFFLGYYKNPINKFAKEEGIDAKIIYALGLLKEGRQGFYEPFLGRLIFPIFSESGKIIGFGGRALDSTSQIKYINSQDSEWYKKGNHLYGFYEGKGKMRDVKKAILVEGYMDVLAMHAMGYENTVASLGTSLTLHQAEVLSRYVDEVYVFYDADSAGRAAASRAVPILFSAGVIPFIVSNNAAKDPAELYENSLSGKVAGFLDTAQDFMDYYIKGDESTTELLKKARKMSEIIKSTKDDFLKGIYTKKLFEKTGIILQEQNPKNIAQVPQKQKKHISTELKLLLASLYDRKLAEFYLNNIKIDYLKEKVSKEIYADYKNGRSFDEILTGFEDEVSRPIVNFLSGFMEYNDAVREDLKKKILDFKNFRKSSKKRNLEEILKEKMEGNTNHERLDNQE